MDTNYEAIIAELIEVITKHEQQLKDIPIALTFVLAPDGCMVVKEFENSVDEGGTGELKKLETPVTLYNNGNL